jgi:SAM-dependent methyltransferase
MGTFQQQLCQQNDIINQEFEKLSNTVNQLRLQVQQQIEIQEKYWLQESYRLFEDEMRSEHHDYILNRRPQITPETILRSRLRMYSDWKYPGMIIRPGLETLASEMVGFDPLYLIDTSPDLLGKVPLINNFTPEYRSRLRNIVIQETLDFEILEKIPDNQFGLCLVYNFFNFRPLEYVRKYLNEIYQKLRPGGVLIMTYNDCSRVPGVQLAEMHFACYTPRTLITDLVEHIGFDRLHTWHNDGASTFLEIRKPGELTSLRGGQTLAKIMYK